MNLKQKQVILLFGDLFLLMTTLPFTLLIRFGRGFNLDLLETHLAPFFLLFAVWIMTFYILDLYDLSLIRAETLFYPRLLGSLLAAGILGVFFFYLFPNPNSVTPKTNLILYLFIFGLLFFLWRRWFYRQARLSPQPLALVGSSPEAEELAREIAARPHLGYQLAAHYSWEKETLAELPEATKKFETIILVKPSELGTSNWRLLAECLNRGANFISLADAYELITGKILLSAIAETWFLEHIHTRGHHFYDKLERFGEIVFASLLLILTLPLWLVIALLIKLEDRGSILFRQIRLGKNQQPFTLLKFRSMRPQAEVEGPRWARPSDPRITRVGRWSRRLHLDEMPQLWNILRGELGFVGPRPERPEFVRELEQKIPYYQMRHLVRPGLTGWAQIKFRYGRSIEDSYEKMQYDLYYLKNRSLTLDLRILLKTLQIFFRRDQ